MRAQAANARWFMDYRNADGSAAEMCGNGTRVFAAYLRREGLETADEFEIATRAGLKLVRFEDGLIAVNLGDWRISDPDGARDNGFDALVKVAGHDPMPGLSLDLGNPHTVVALPDSADLAGLDLTRAPEINPQPPLGTNVEFVRPLGDGHLSDAGPRARRGGDPLLRHGRRGRRAGHPLVGRRAAPTPTYGASTSRAAPCASGRCPASRSSWPARRSWSPTAPPPSSEAAPVSRGGAAVPGRTVPVHGQPPSRTSQDRRRGPGRLRPRRPPRPAGHGLGVRPRERAPRQRHDQQAPHQRRSRCPRCR